MGNTLQGFVNKHLFKQKNARILIHGLDAAGKTTVLYRLKLGEVVTTIPTIGFNVETLEYRTRRFNINLTAWDVGGRDKIRPLWRHYYQNTDALIFVVDSNDRARIDQAKDELHKILREDELAGIPILVFANKQDLPNAASSSKISGKLGLNSIRDRAWFIQGACATKGEGLYEGLDWLGSVIWDNLNEEHVKKMHKKVEDKLNAQLVFSNSRKKKEGTVSSWTGAFRSWLGRAEEFARSNSYAVAAT